MLEYLKCNQVIPGINWNWTCFRGKSYLFRISI